MLKKLVVGTALATLLAVPAFAAQSHRTHTARNVEAAQSRNAYAYAPGTTSATGRFDAVYADGHYVGQDPDPNVRLMLQRDYSHEQ